eukprot:CAMPEP_0118961992 /NCGR_PEP_ID=MMETSP1173-20130426/485_1 /TAXON_ID=1034831 /ORGANISM="Rhizochromulina marina cf, Strain CCMP1243" /LENGTH=160 /DNA_ID=CAMNT_0006910201 /DNA_START=71 /DNA_END=551 /DNA_ORIENTATION=+
MDVNNLQNFDAFADADDEQGDNSKIHIRVQQRNGRKCITTVQGLADDLDIKRICKAFKKNFSCNGAVTKDEEMGEIVQLSGDQRTNVKAFLTDQEIAVMARSSSTVSEHPHLEGARDRRQAARGRVADGLMVEASHVGTTRGGSPGPLESRVTSAVRVMW